MGRHDRHVFAALGVPGHGPRRTRRLQRRVHRTRGRRDALRGEGHARSAEWRVDRADPPEDGAVQTDPHPAGAHREPCDPDRPPRGRPFRRERGPRRPAPEGHGPLRHRLRLLTWFDAPSGESGRRPGIGWGHAW
ncbi:hypothetical protein PLANTIT3_20211 [Plantibacter sp. T3]|nr:hypothetical protein PLANTIT3_20211 [Plantibacter sp. T3]